MYPEQKAIFEYDDVPFPVRKVGYVGCLIAPWRVINHPNHQLRNQVWLDAFDAWDHERKRLCEAKTVTRDTRHPGGPK